MDKPTFTPGPWTFTNKGFVNAPTLPCAPVVVSCGDPSGGEITNGIGCLVSDQRGEGIANAQLIAAAPDLYTACEALLKTADDEGGADDAGQISDELFWAAVRLARVALAKAKGEATNV